MLKKLSKNFFQEVYEVVSLVPKGRVTTYGAIAHYLGSKSSAFMVGWALHQIADQHATILPVHRVVNRQGLLTGKHHFTDGCTMEQLLAAEGVQVQADQVKNFEKLFWDPVKEAIPFPFL